MKAVRIHQHGGPDVLRYEDAPDPVPASGEALVRVRACALNHLDLWHRRGIDRVTTPFPLIPGSDVSGEVLEPGSSGFRPGRRVMLQPGISCGRCVECLSGRDNACELFGTIGTRRPGGYAELIAVPVANLVPIPDHIDFVVAAAFPLTFVTAWHMLLTRAGLKAGETVLVIAAGSGVGQAAVQIARLFHARVIATAGTDAKLSRSLEIGADHAVNHHTDDLPARVRALTDGRGVDVVIEHVGQAIWDRAVRCLARNGRLVTCGATTGYEAHIDLRFLFVRQLSFLGSYMGSKGELLDAARFFFSGHLKPVVDRTYPLKEAAAAQMQLERGDHFGKIVLVC